VTEVVISFDTEDYVDPKAADGILRASRIVRDAGFCPCHNVVARLAEALVQWGRQDIIEELRQCEISTHSLRHSHHPTINEYTDIEDFDEAMRRFRAEEDQALKITQSIIGNEYFAAACPPGDSVSYVATYGYADMGIPVYDGSLVYDKKLGRPLSYCNMLNLEYHCSMDHFGTMTQEDIRKMADKMAKYEVAIAYHHPARNTVTQFCDILNFYRENKEGEWIFADRRPEEEITRFEENLRFFMELLKTDPRFRVVTYTDIAQKYSSYRVVKPEMIPVLKKALEEDFFPVTVPESLSLADMMLACRDFLLGEKEHVCTKVYGFLKPPYAIGQPVRVSAEGMRASAAQIQDGKFLPEEILVDGKKLGPADWLRAALTILSGEESAVVVPDVWQIDLNEFPDLRDLDLEGSWVHMLSMKDEYLSDRMRLQSWTIRLPRASQRKIYG